MYNAFLEFLNEQKDDDSIYIRLTSSGGSDNMSDLLSDIINNDDRIKQITFDWQISSTAFDLMTKIYLKRKINTNVWSILHISTRDVDYRDNRNKDEHTRFLVEDIERNNIRTIEKFRKIGVSEENIKLIEQGKDVYLIYEDIMKLKI